MKYLVYNGALIEEQKFHINISNRAFNYGDGLFETIIVKKDKILFIENHFQRLMDGMAALHIEADAGFNLSTFKKNILQVAEANPNSEKKRVKFQVWRKPGGLFTPQNNNVDFIVSTSTFQERPAMLNNVGFYNDIRINPSTISAFKTLNALPYILASIQKQKLLIDDLILSDHESNISECCNSNIYFVKDQILHTPSLSTGCIRGIIRTEIINYCKRQNIPFIEGKFKKEELLKADYVFNSNVAGLSIIKKIDQVKFSIKAELALQITNNLLAELYD